MNHVDPYCHHQRHVAFSSCPMANASIRLLERQSTQFIVRGYTLVARVGGGVEGMETIFRNKL